MNDCGTADENADEVPLAYLKADVTQPRCQLVLGPREVAQPKRGQLLPQLFTQANLFFTRGKVVQYGARCHKPAETGQGFPEM